jgi:lysozyme family protein
MPNNFDFAVDIVLDHECGSHDGKRSGLVDDKLDPGGVTKWGISYRFMSRIKDSEKYFGHSGVTRNDIVNMSMNTAKKI